MPSSAAATVIQLMESLPEATQNQVVERVRDFIEEIGEEAVWDETFAKTRPALAAAARRAKQQIAEGLAKPLDPDQCRV